MIKYEGRSQQNYNLWSNIQKQLSQITADNYIRNTRIYKSLQQFKSTLWISLHLIPVSTSCKAEDSLKICNAGSSPPLSPTLPISKKYRKPNSSNNILRLHFLIYPTSLKRQKWVGRTNGALASFQKSVKCQTIVERPL